MNVSKEAKTISNVSYGTYRRAAEEISMGLSSTIKLAHEAGAVVKIGKSARVNIKKLLAYLDSRCGESEGAR